MLRRSFSSHCGAGTRQSKGTATETLALKRRRQSRPSACFGIHQEVPLSSRENYQGILTLGPETTLGSQLSDVQAFCLASYWATLLSSTRVCQPPLKKARLFCCRTRRFQEHRMYEDAIGQATTWKRCLSSIHPRRSRCPRSVFARITS